MGIINILYFRNIVLIFVLSGFHQAPIDLGKYASFCKLNENKTNNPLSIYFFRIFPLKYGPRVDVSTSSVHSTKSLFAN